MKTLDCGIYAFTNAVTGKRYIGQSVKIEGRRKHHLSTLRRGIHRSSYFQSAFNKYGEAAFVHEVLELCSSDELTQREQHWMDTYRLAGLYNSAPAAGSIFGLKLSAEAKAKISASNKGRIIPQSTKDAVRAMRLASKATAETREKMRLAQTGRKHSAETRLKISASGSGLKKPQSAEQIAKATAARLASPKWAASKSRIGDAVRGKKQTPEQIAKRVAAANETKRRNKLLKQAATV